MDQVALYESQEPDVDITNDAAAQSDDDVGSQVYEAVKLRRLVFHKKKWKPTRPGIYSQEVRVEIA